MQNKFINDFTESTLAYYNQLAKYKPLTREKERELLAKAKNGDNNAKNKLIEANLKFVFAVAKRYKGQGVAIEDLISEGNLGLEYAIRKFDTSRDNKLISYAVRWIQYYIQRLITKYNQLDTCELESTVIGKRNSINEEDWTEESINDTQWFNNIEDVPSLEEEKSNNRAMIINKVFEYLDAREKIIIEKYYGLNGNNKVKLKEIGNDIGITAERVRQLRNIAFTKIKNKVNNNSVLRETVYSCLS